MQSKLYYGLITGITAASFFSSIAFSQLSKQDKRGISEHLVATINRGINKYQSKASLREKVVRRMAECAFIYRTLSKEVEGETKIQFLDAGEISHEVLALVSDQVDMDRYKAIVSSAMSGMVEMSKRQNKRELFLLLRSCKSFHDPSEVDSAIRELTLN
jgi:hypothetical protein